MKSEMKEKPVKRFERRAFFGQLFAAAGGGLLAGNFLRGLAESRKEVLKHKRPVSISSDPLAVPRTKGGSKSNV